MQGFCCTDQGNQAVIKRLFEAHTRPAAKQSTVIPLLDLDLFPVPANDEVHVNVPEALSGGSLVLRDALGRQALVHPLVSGPNTVAIGHLVQGIYTAEVITARSAMWGAW
jgi:hypothetical protein